MIYLTIPKGMVFKKITTEDQDKKTSEIRDCFIDATGKNIIELQDLVKDALRTNTGRKKCIKLDQFTIYLRTPPNTDEPFLAYNPNHNGRYPTATEPEYVIGKNAQKYDPKIYSSYGTFWSHHMYLTRSQEIELEEKRLAQKENRRHYGDCPLPT
ncbi:Permease [Legionella gratiana]|uniref:Permease n=1 Tax=Legionella gratiana TaxID=45066 RepID=A0A378JF45_9GAMM|nr:hypothetical protein [Legionella gratiana]KTD09230.1 Permease [Legionella gratiana]STX45517.1 Permease [Legionella gratiana]